MLNLCNVVMLKQLRMFHEVVFGMEFDLEIW